MNLTQEDYTEHKERAKEVILRSSTDTGRTTFQVSAISANVDTHIHRHRHIHSDTHKHRCIHAHIDVSCYTTKHDVHTQEIDSQNKRRAVMFIHMYAIFLSDKAHMRSIAAYY